MATAYFLKIDTVKGESTDANHKDEIEIIAFSHGVSQPTSAVASTSGGLTSGRCNHTDLSIQKGLDIASPTLSALCCSGKHVGKVTLVCERSDGDKRVPYFKIVLTDVIISSVQVSGAGEVPSESVTFNYGKIEWEYTKQNIKGGAAGGKSTGSWNLAENKA